MTDPKATLLLCKWLRDRVKVWEAEAKRTLGMRPGERLAGEIGATHLGFVTLARGKRSTDVDEQALLEWVKTHYPTEVEESVRPAFRKKLLDQALNLGGGLVDPSGEVAEGIVLIEHGAPYPTPQLDDHADIAISALLQSGRIGIDGIRAIEGADK